LKAIKQKTKEMAQYSFLDFWLLNSSLSGFGIHSLSSWLPNEPRQQSRFAALRRKCPGFATRQRQNVYTWSRAPGGGRKEDLKAIKPENKKTWSNIPFWISGL
jgi:hypothetical protein